MKTPDKSVSTQGAQALDPEAPSQQQRGVSPWQIILPFVILLGAGFFGWVIVHSKPAPEEHTPPPRVVAVETVTVQPQTVNLGVESQGVVRARTRTQLTPEVSGRIDAVSPNFRDGAIIKKGEMLIRIDAVDYEAALANAQANLAQAKFNLAQEQALSEQALADWEDLGRGEPSDLALRKPQLEQAQAMIDSAESAVTRAQRDLERTELRAPYDGRVIEQTADVGQFVSPNTPLGTIYATDIAEVFLPLSADELARLDLPTELDAMGKGEGPSVTLSTNFGGREFSWQGQVVRTGATFDERSRLLDVVVEVPNPLQGDAAQPGRPALKPGKFVQAEIEGREARSAFVVPRYALREGDTVLIAKADNTLSQRKVTVIQADTEFAIISEGLEAGDRVITSPVEYVIEGMSLVVESDGAES